jgi:phage-related minor tail protein
MPELDKRIAAPIVNNDVLDKMIAKQAQSVIDANADALERLKDAKADELAATIESLKFEEEKLLESYKRRHESIMSSTEHTETEKKALIIRLNDQTLQEVEVGVQKLHSNIDKDTPAEGFDKLFGSGALVSLFSDLDNIEERFKSLLANIAAQALASGIASALTGGTFGGGFSSSIGEAFGGFKASGGPVSGNTSYVVGERGPELFVPNTGGSIVPNDALGGGSVQTHNYFDIDEALNGFMSTSPAERAVMNIVSRNQRTIRSLSQ